LLLLKEQIYFAGMRREMNVGARGLCAESLLTGRMPDHYTLEGSYPEASSVRRYILVPLGILLIVENELV
jgi:hypothetical protein